MVVKADDVAAAADDEHPPSDLANSKTRWGGAGCLRELIVAVRALPVDTKATRLITEVRKLKPQSCQ